jgi:hypothetical protein
VCVCVQVWICYSGTAGDATALPFPLPWACSDGTQHATHLFTTPVPAGVKVASGVADFFFDLSTPNPNQAAHQPGSGGSFPAVTTNPSVILNVVCTGAPEGGGPLRQLSESDGEPPRVTELIPSMQALNGRRLGKDGGGGGGGGVVGGGSGVDLNVPLHPAANYPSVQVLAAEMDGDYSPTSVARITAYIDVEEDDDDSMLPDGTICHPSSACVWIRELTLHDNPASSYELPVGCRGSLNYAHTHETTALDIRVSVRGPTTLRMLPGRGIEHIHPPTSRTHANGTRVAPRPPASPACKTHPSPPPRQRVRNPC